MKPCIPGHTQAASDHVLAWLAVASASQIRSYRDCWRMSGPMIWGVANPYDFDELIAAAEKRETAANAAALAEELAEREAMYA